MTKQRRRGWERRRNAVLRELPVCAVFWWMALPAALPLLKLCFKPGVLRGNTHTRAHTHTELLELLLLYLVMCLCPLNTHFQKANSALLHRAKVSSTYIVPPLLYFNIRTFRGNMTASLMPVECTYFNIHHTGSYAHTHCTRLTVKVSFLHCNWSSGLIVDCAFAGLYSSFHGSALAILKLPCAVLEMHVLWVLGAVELLPEEKKRKEKKGKERKGKEKKNKVLSLFSFPSWELLLCFSREILKSTRQMAAIAFLQFPPKPWARKCLYVCGSVYTWVKHGDGGQEKGGITSHKGLWQGIVPPVCPSSTPPALSKHPSAHRT